MSDLKEFTDGEKLGPMAMTLLSPEASSKVASIVRHQNRNPKKVARELRREGLIPQDAPSQEYVDDITEIQNKIYNRRKSRFIDPLIKQKQTRDWRLKEVKAHKSADRISGGMWNKKFAEDVANDLRFYGNAPTATNRANMEAVPRALKKEGWTMRHASSGKSGRKSSRYLVSPDGKYEVRLTDHELPGTPQRDYNQQQFGGPRWDDEVILYGDENPQEIIDRIKILERDGENT